MIQVSIPGYEHLKIGKRTNALVVRSFAGFVRDILKTQSLYEYAENHSEQQTRQGRGPVYVIPFGHEQVRVAVRHAMRGGWMAKLLRDRFLPPTRGFRELMNSIQLRTAGVPTPELIAFTTYPAGGPFRRSDVVTRYVEGADLAAVLGDARNDAYRKPIFSAVRTLLEQLVKAGAQHADLNLKNILISATDTGYAAYVLDVDRIHFHAANDPLVVTANAERLIRSLNKWRALPGTRRNAISDEEIKEITAIDMPQQTPMASEEIHPS